MALYESDHTKFIREWLKAHPEELQEQKDGRALWWDKPSQDQEEMKRRTEAKVPTKAYYYDAN
ncbi:hypothetical protein DLREEDagrD3_10680 [Denitratisoma sp. agr-D3]